MLNVLLTYMALKVYLTGVCYVGMIVLQTYPCYAQTYTEIKRIADTIATQAVAVDKKYYYAIGNHTIAKYNKQDGTKVAEWEGGAKGVIKHLNSGVVIKNKLYCANSNYREFPMASSIEIFDVKTLKPLDSQSFGIYEGSCTWVTWHQSYWWAMFVHYDNYAPNSGTDVSWSSLVKFDKEWRRIESWILPDALLPKIKPYSISGGVFIDDTTLYCTHHHNEEIYVLKIPAMGFTLEWTNTLPVPIQGQGIALDPKQKGVIWGLHRERKEVIAFKIN